MKRMNLLMVLMGILLLSSVLGADVYTTGCWEGNLTSDTNYYLTDDIVGGVNSSCFRTDAGIHNVIFDCQGYKMTPSPLSTDLVYGFFIDGGFNNNITIQNCNIEDWISTGIGFWNASNINVKNSYFENNGVLDASPDIGFGSRLDNVIKQNVLIENCTFNNTNENQRPQLYFQDMEDIIIQNNNFFGYDNGTHYFSQGIGFDNFANNDTVTNIDISHNTFDKIETIIDFNDVVNSFSDLDFSYNIINNTYKQILTFPMFFDNLNNGVIHHNDVYNFNGDNTDYAGAIAFYVRDSSSNIEVYENTCTNVDGVCINVRDSTNITVHDNQGFEMTNANKGSETGLEFSRFIEMRNSDDCEVYDNELISESSTIQSVCIHLRETATNMNIHDNICRDTFHGLTFRAGGTYDGLLLEDNTFTNHDVGIEFADRTDTMTITNNNIYSNTVNVNSTISRNISGNYYGEGDVNSTLGFCVVQPYTEGNVNDYTSYCCFDAWDLGCTYTPLTGAWSPEYNEADISESFINLGVKALITLGKFIVIAVIIFLISYAIVYLRKGRV